MIYKTSTCLIVIIFTFIFNFTISQRDQGLLSSVTFSTKLKIKCDEYKNHLIYIHQIQFKNQSSSNDVNLKVSEKINEKCNKKIKCSVDVHENVNQTYFFHFQVYYSCEPEIVTNAIICANNIYKLKCETNYGAIILSAFAVVDRDRQICDRNSNKNTDLKVGNVTDVLEVVENKCDLFPISCEFNATDIIHSFESFGYLNITYICDYWNVFYDNYEGKSSAKIRNISVISDRRVSHDNYNVLSTVEFVIKEPSDIKSIAIYILLGLITLIIFILFMTFYKKKCESKHSNQRIRYEKYDNEEGDDDNQFSNEICLIDDYEPLTSKHFKQELRLKKIELNEEVCTSPYYVTLKNPYQTCEINAEKIPYNDLNQYL